MIDLLSLVMLIEIFRHFLLFVCVKGFVTLMRSESTLRTGLPHSSAVHNKVFLFFYIKTIISPLFKM